MYHKVFIKTTITYLNANKRHNLKIEKQRSKINCRKLFFPDEKLAEVYCAFISIIVLKTLFGKKIFIIRTK